MIDFIHDGVFSTQITLTPPLIDVPERFLMGTILNSSKSLLLTGMDSTSI